MITKSGLNEQSSKQGNKLFVGSAKAKAVTSRQQHNDPIGGSIYKFIDRIASPNNNNNSFLNDKERLGVNKAAYSDNKATSRRTVCAQECCLDQATTILPVLQEKAWKVHHFHTAAPLFPSHRYKF